jgi:hypothetical protein
VRALLTLLPLVACGGQDVENPQLETAPPLPITCVTRCGLQYYGDQPCSDLDEVEAVTLRRLSGVPGLPSTEVACASLHNWSVLIHKNGRYPDGAWTHEGELVVGLAWCRSTAIEINDVPLKYSSLPHEMVHAIERCPPPPHAGWKERGVFSVIEDIREELQE